MILGDVHLQVTSEVVFHYQHVFDLRLLFKAYSYFHLDVVNVDQVHGLHAYDGFQPRLLQSHLELYAATAVVQASDSFLHHFWPPESFLD